MRGFYECLKQGSEPTMNPTSGSACFIRHRDEDVAWRHATRLGDDIEVHYVAGDED